MKHFAVYLKLAQHFKPTILQLKKNTLKLGYSYPEGDYTVVAKIVG